MKPFTKILLAFYRMVGVESPRIVNEKRFEAFALIGIIGGLIGVIAGIAGIAVAIIGAYISVTS